MPLKGMGVTDQGVEFVLLTLCCLSSKEVGGAWLGVGPDWGRAQMWAGLPCAMNPLLSAFKGDGSSQGELAGGVASMCH